MAIRTFGLEGNKEIERRLSNFIWKRGRITADIFYEMKCLLFDALEIVQTRERRQRHPSELPPLARHAREVREVSKVVKASAKQE